LELDTDTNKRALYADLNTFAPSSGLAAGLHFNSRLMELFTGLQNYFIGYDGDLNYYINIRNRNGSNVVKRNGQDFIYMSQEISSVGLWSPVASLVFCSSMLPIHPTQTTKPNVLSNQSSNLVSSGDNSNLTNILSDFEISIQEANSYRPTILYAPTAEYRLLDMYSGVNLNRLNIAVFWKDCFGELHPFLINPGCAAHMKLMFRKKDFDVTD